MDSSYFGLGEADGSVLAELLQSQWGPVQGPPESRDRLLAVRPASRHGFRVPRAEEAALGFGSYQEETCVESCALW